MMVRHCRFFHGAGVFPTMLGHAWTKAFGGSWMQLVAFVLRFWGGSDQNGSTWQLLSMCGDCWNRVTLSCSPMKRQHVSRWLTFADFPQGSCLICARGASLVG